MLNPPSARTLILGVGNLLMSDAGVGLHVVQRLTATCNLPEGVQVLDGGTLGLGLLYYLTMLFAAKLEDVYPRNVVLLGVQPASLELGLELAPVVQAQVDVWVSQAMRQLERRGH